MKFSMKPLVTAFAVMMLLTSCVDNTVPELVNQIRTAQVNLANAKTRLAEAEAEEQEIQNDYAAASNAIQLQIQEINLQSSESQLAVTIANNEYSVRNAQANLQAAELQLQIAMDNLADYLASQGLENAEEYLDEYYGALSQINNLRGDA